MSCDEMEAIEDMYEQQTLAERGYSPEEVQYLTDKVAAARAAANVQAAEEGRTIDEQARMVAEAQTAAINDWHIEMHAKLDGYMKAIAGMKQRVAHQTD
jgi:predicted metalloprotease with PDZ domain